MTGQAALYLGAFAFVVGAWNMYGTHRLKKLLREDADRREDYIRNRIDDLEKVVLTIRRRALMAEIDVLRATGDLKADVPFQISDDCVACGSCAPECPTGAIYEGKIFWIDPKECIACGSCAEVCPTGSCVPYTDIVHKSQELRLEAMAGK